MCSNPESIQTKSERENMFEGLSGSTLGGSDFDPNSINKILKMLRSLFGLKAESKRRRRTTVAKEVELMTPTQVRESILLG